jgi:hypothetical protein
MARNSLQEAQQSINRATERTEDGKPAFNLVRQ